MMHTNGTRLERWLGAAAVDRVSASMLNWYGPPIPLAGVPGRVHAVRGGEFIGRIDGGTFAGFLDFAEERGRKLHRIATRLHNALMRLARGQKLYMGFSSFADLVMEATIGGKRRYFPFRKVSSNPGNTVGETMSLWRVGNQPPAGAAAAAAPGGTIPTSASTGAFRYTNPDSPDTLHLTRADIAGDSSSGSPYTLLLYDRLFAVAKTMNSTATEAVTGVPTRYQSTTGGAVNSAEGNFVFIECGTTLGAGAHNWTVCTYTDQGGTAGVTLPSVTGNSINDIGRLDMPLFQWFCPLATGDTGLTALTQMQCSALIGSGAIDFVIGHPLAIFPLPLVNQGFIYDGVNSAFNLNQIFDNAALAFLELNKNSIDVMNYTGLFEAVAG